MALTRQLNPDEGAEVRIYCSGQIHHPGIPSCESCDGLLLWDTQEWEGKAASEESLIPFIAHPPHLLKEGSLVLCKSAQINVSEEMMTQRLFFAPLSPIFHM